MTEGATTGVQAGGTFGLGRWSVHRVGYGAMQLAGDNVFGPPRDRDEALRVLRAAVDSGINHIDTAQYYGPGVVNELLREALFPYPAGLAIVSKVAARRDAAGAVLPYDEPDQLVAGIEDNLRTLGADRLAAVNLRLLDDAVPGERFDAQLAALVRARDEGLIDGVGLSNVSPAHLTRALEQTEVVCVQNVFNLADQRSLDLVVACAARGIAFVPFCPLGWPRDAKNGLLANPVLVETGVRLGASAAQMALAWLLDLAPNVLLIPGTRTRQHLAENVGSGAIRLDGEARAALAGAFPPPSR
ncbi:MAG TPA: oxidoreductase [Acidimicrobiales bacterium]|nr:oxidoreductase [Acidimicrobiales bacterium]